MHIIRLSPDKHKLDYTEQECVCPQGSRSWNGNRWSRSWFAPCVLYSKGHPEEIKPVSHKRKEGPSEERFQRRSIGRAKDQSETIFSDASCSLQPFVLIFFEAIYKTPYCSSGGYARKPFLLLCQPFLELIPVNNFLCLYLSAVSYAYTRQMFLILIFVNRFLFFILQPFLILIFVNHVVFFTIQPFPILTFVNRFLFL